MVMAAAVLVDVVKAWFECGGGGGMGGGGGDGCGVVTLQRRDITRRFLDLHLTVKPNN